MTEALAFFLLHWKAILTGGFMIALGVALAIERGEAVHYHKIADQNAATAVLANSKLAISNASIATLNDALDAANAQSDARAKAYADSKATDAATITALDKQYASTKSARDALMAIAAVPGGNGACRIPSALSAALEGL